MKNLEQIGKEELFKAIRKVYEEYRDRLPRLNIENNEWQAFFKETSKHFNMVDLADDYPVALNIIFKQAINMALLDNAKEVTFNYILDALSDLTIFHLFTEEIDEIKKNIKEEIQESNNKKYIKK